MGTYPERKLAEGQTQELPRLNTEFHVGVANACGNASLAVLLRQVSAKIEWVYSLGVEARAASSWAEHRVLLDAILAGDVARTSELIDDHVGQARRAYCLEPVSDPPAPVSS